MGPYTRELLAEMISGIHDRLSEVENRVRDLETSSKEVPPRCGERFRIAAGNVYQCCLIGNHGGNHRA